jgi:hypothetical protein
MATAVLRVGQAWRAWARGFACALALSAANPCNAQTAVAPEGSLAERARIVLEAYCAECREAGAAAIDMNALAHNPRLVMPKRPDASRAYLRLFVLGASTRGKAADGDDDKKDESKRTDTKSKDANASDKKPNAEHAEPDKPHTPTPIEIETVRDWIASLPARNEACLERSPITAAEVEDITDRWMHTVGPAEAADTRFLSLLHLWNACEPDDRLHTARTAAIALLTVLARNRGAPETIEIETLGDESALLVVRPSALAMPASEWDRLTASAPTAVPNIVPADWLAAHLLAPSSDGSGDAMKVDGAIQQQLEPLTRRWTEDVDLVRAAAERDVSVRELAEALTAHGNGEWLDARRLLNQSLSRVAWDNLNRALDGATAAERREKPVSPDNDIDVVVWTDKPVYRPRDLITINVSVSKACHLTLIDVDRDGKAIVLFPNELHQENLMAPGVAYGIPGNDAGYQLRLDRAGEETLVAVCQRHDLTPEGIAYDYEKQRFRILGDWRTFLRTAALHEQEIRAQANSETNRRRRRGRSAPKVEAPAAVAPNEIVEGRAAATVIIEPGSLAHP